MDRNNMTTKLNNANVYFDKSVLYGVSTERWDEFWQLARQRHIRGYYSPITYIEIVTGLFNDFEYNKRCFEKIAVANLDILEYSEICIAKFILGGEGIPEKLLREEELNYRVFKGTPDFILNYCNDVDDLNKQISVNIFKCPCNLRTLIESREELKSRLLFVIRKFEGPLYKLNFDFNLIRKCRERYEERWMQVMQLMQNIVEENLNKRAKTLKLNRINIPFITKSFESSPEFAKLFLDALIERAATFIFQVDESLFTFGKQWDTQEAAQKLRPLNAFYEAYKNLTVNKLSGGVSKNDYNDLHLLPYLGKGFYLITNDNKLLKKIESSTQRNFAMTFNKAFNSLKY